MHVREIKMEGRKKQARLEAHLCTTLGNFKGTVETVYIYVDFCSVRN